MAIDLSGRMLRVMEGAIGSPLRHAEVAIPADVLDGARVLDRKRLSALLLEVTTRAGIRPSRSLLAASDRIASWRILTLPRGTTDAGIVSAMRSELPLPADRLAVHWVELARQDSTLTVFAIGSDRRQARELAAAARDAGFEPETLDVRSLCLVRAVVLADCIIVEAGGGSCVMTIVQSRVPRLHSRFDLSGSPDASLGSVIADGIRRGIAPLAGRAPDSSPGEEVPVVLVGEPLPSATLDEISQLLRRPVQLLQPPRRIGADVPYVQYLVCLGLLMRRR